MTTKEVEGDKPKSIAERIQILLIIVIGVILPYGANSIMNREFHSASDFIILIASMIVPLTIVIVIERKKNHRKFMAQ